MKILKIEARYDIDSRIIYDLETYGCIIKSDEDLIELHYKDDKDLAKKLSEIFYTLIEK